MVRRYRHVRRALQIGLANFEDSPDRYAVKCQDTHGIRQSLFRIEKGIALQNRSRLHQPQLAWIPIGLIPVSS